MMIDQACGFDPNNPPPPPPRPTDEQLQAAFTAVFDAALAWQRNHRKGAARLTAAVKAARKLGFR